MNGSHHTVAFREQDIDWFLAHYSGDGTPYRILMHLWATGHAETLKSLLAAVGAHRARVKKALQLLTGDGLVVERTAAGSVTYALVDDVSGQSWVVLLLKRAVQERRIGTRR